MTHFCIRYTDDPQRDIENGFTCWDTRTTVAELVREYGQSVLYNERKDLGAHEFYASNCAGLSDEAAAEAINEFWGDDIIVQRKDGRWGIFHHDGLAVWQIYGDPTTEQEAEEFYRAGECEGNGGANGSIAVNPVVVKKIEKNVWLLGCDDFNVVPE